MHEFRYVNDLVYYHWHRDIPLFPDSVEKAPFLIRPVLCPKKAYKSKDIEIVQKLGEGNFGIVYLVKLIADGRSMAMKTLKDCVSDEVKCSFVEEMKMIAPMKHENVVQCLGTVEDGSVVKILLELVNKGSLITLLRTGRLTDRGKARVLLHVAKGLQYLHRHYIIHRDLAARNILIHQNQDGNITAKVSDFGLSFRDQTGQGYLMTSIQCLPVKWLAPECFTKNRWTLASDVWSFGILAWEVFNNGKEPYTDQSFGGYSSIVRYIKQGGHPVRMDEVTIPQMRKIMQSCWMIEQERRPNMDDLVYELEIMYPSVK